MWEIPERLLSDRVVIMNTYKILGTFTGKPAKLANGLESAIIKHEASVLIIKKNVIQHDQVANKFHGGDMRVVHHYSLKNYESLKRAFPGIAERFVPGSFGENILTEELSENDLNIGDIYSLGSAKIQLTVSRRPCATINFAYQDDRILNEVIKSGHTGWFYRVIEEGEVRVGNHLKLLESPFHGLSVAKLHNQGYGKNKFSDLPFIRRCLDTGLMDPGWRAALESALNS